MLPSLCIHPTKCIPVNFHPPELHRFSLDHFRALTGMPEMQVFIQSFCTRVILPYDEPDGSGCGIGKTECKGKVCNGLSHSLPKSLRVKGDPELRPAAGFPRDDRKTGYLPVIVCDKDIRPGLLAVIIEPATLPECV